VLLTAAFVQAQPAKLPSFEEFKTTEVFQGKPAPPRLTTPFARKFRSAIREAAQNGPNFAGSFAIVQWGCGGSCIQMAIVNERTGAVYPGPFTVLDFAAPHRFVDRSDSSQADSFEPLVFRKDSRLFVVRGCPEENQGNCALFYYEWNGLKFRLLQRFPAIQ
jgi:hypothetical protein